jgi:hypothetical protein
MSVFCLLVQYVYAVICLRAHYKYYLSANIYDDVFKFKYISRPDVQNIINRVLQFFPQEKSNGKFKYPTENAAPYATAAIGKSETPYEKHENKLTCQY